MSIERFKGAVQDLSRPNRFEVYGNILGRDLRFLAKGTSLPSATLGVMPVPYMGREIKYAGDRTYDDWEITVYQANNGAIRRQIDNWMQIGLTHEANIGATAALAYKYDMNVVQLDRAGRQVMQYQMIGCIPISLGSLELSWESNDTPAEFPVTFAYDYYVLR